MCVFCFALGTGLSYLIVRTAQYEQLVVLSDDSRSAGQIFRKRLEDLDAEVREVVKRVELVSTQLVDAAHVAGTPPPTGDIPGEPSNGTQLSGVSPLEARWRERLEGSLREMMETREDLLDITYLGRFTAIPNGALTVVRVERTSDGEFVTSQNDPRPEWDASFLQAVIQSDTETAMISPPFISGDDDEARFASMRGADPVQDGEGAVVGVAMVSLELSDVLGRMTRGLPETAESLFVTDDGLSLLHPSEDGKFERADSGTQVVNGLYPGLLAEFKKSKGASRQSFAAETSVSHLDRFAIGGEASDVRFTLVLSAPYAPVDFATAMKSAGTLAWGVVSGQGPLALVAAGMCGLALVAAGFVIVRRKRGTADIREAAEQGGASVLAERASAIEAEESLLADVEGPAEEAEGDNRENALAAASAADPNDSEVSDDEEQDASADYERAPIEAADDEQEIDAAQSRVESDDESSSLDAGVEQEAAEERELPSTVSEASLGSAHELAVTRNRLEEELEEARQRSLDELAAARERFEVELAGERDRAIARLIEESRRALAVDALGCDIGTTTAALPSIEPGEFDLRRLLADVAAWMEGETFGQDQEFGIRCNRNVPNQLVGDPDWLGPLLVNLGKTAAHSSDGGRVELNVSCADEGAAGVRVCFELRAADIGFDALPGGHLRERRPGALALVEELVESMHGEMRAERLSSTGSALRVVLPMSLPS